MTTGETIFSITNLEKFDIYGIFLYMNISHMMIQIHLVNTYRDFIVHSEFINTSSVYSKVKCRIIASYGINWDLVNDQSKLNMILMTTR